MCTSVRACVSVLVLVFLDVYFARAHMQTHCSAHAYSVALIFIAGKARLLLVSLYALCWGHCAIVTHDCSG